jgi:hypothetical protein
MESLSIALGNRKYLPLSASPRIWWGIGKRNTIKFNRRGRIRSEILCYILRRNGGAFAYGQGVGGNEMSPFCNIHNQK